MAHDALRFIFVTLSMNSSNQPDTGIPIEQAATPAVDDIDLLQDSLAYEIKKAQVRSYEVLFEFFGPEALSPGRMTALCIIGNQPGINQSALAEALRVNRASVVKVIDALQAAGFVERHSIPEDRRSYALAVTPVGYQELVKLTALSRRYEEVIAAQLSPQERKTLMRLLAKVAVNHKMAAD
ncbi:MarR family transcriptional regulator [Pusillimonas sp.]|uniref:MarR family winged helix-turn-helix transcriptional regulator n=1 Tax=Pusillimonas sp. TaxID=3040095 RepID=UPI002D802534|nr:MarR family transcriptional regulator [Pusillimonas sp.]